MARRLGPNSQVARPLRPCAGPLPQVMRLIRDPQQFLSITDIGIALLLFIVGLELQPTRLWRLRKDIFGLGFAQVVLCGLAISLLLYVALGISIEASLAVGLPL